MKLSSYACPFVVFAGLLCPSASIFAAIDVIPKEVTLETDATSVQVINHGDRPEYITISLSRLLNPGVPLDDERLEPVSDAAHPSLYAYPFRMSLAPGQTKKLTLKPLHPVETETVYRLDVKPVVKMLGSEKNMTSASVVVNLAFSGLVRQLPARQREALSVECDEQGARVTATGNVRSRVEGAKVDGRALDAFNVYPGVPLPVSGKVVAIPGHSACR
ncbi:hypothetical protein WT27_25515 [Burkholderia territorii]|uniref:Pilus assembly protein n=1 Tax=Burkholderia territorii TaxID=1503055 RepID=A0A106DEF3_9BURK|nr:hypothetical protein [Burkholderia territorii]KVV55661.1 hypothetical protein WT27_25515 [Burkholderia territorii]KVX27634.1 hypothetical protein WT31_14195 [Burkholderia territorii]